MGADPRELRKGERIGQGDWNAVVAELKRLRARLGGGAGEFDGFAPDPSVALVKNTTAGDLGRFAVLALGDPIIDPAANEAEGLARPTFQGSAPTAGTGTAFGILQEPAPAGGIVRACVAGVTWARVNVTSTGHRFARPAAGNVSVLASSGVGGAPILHKPTGTGVKWCLIRVEAACDCGEPVEGSGSGGPLVNVACGPCVSELASYCVRFPGVTDSGDWNCTGRGCAAMFDVDIQLDHSGTTDYGGCVWRAGFTFCTSPTPGFGDVCDVTITLFYLAGRWRLYVSTCDGAVIVVYEADEAATLAWDCRSSLTLSLTSTSFSGPCAGWPATVTLGACGGGGGGGGGGSGVSSTQLGSTHSTGAAGTLTLALSGTVPAGKLLIVSVSHKGSPGGITGITAGGVALSLAAGTHVTTTVYGEVWTLKTTGSVSGNVVATFSGNYSAAAVAAEYVDGLASNAVGTTAQATGGSGNLAYLFADALDSGFLFTLLATNAPGTDPDPSWTSSPAGLAGGGQDAGTSGAAGGDVRLATGHLPNTAAGSSYVQAGWTNNHAYVLLAVPCN